MYQYNFDCINLNNVATNMKLAMQRDRFFRAKTSRAKSAFEETRRAGTSRNEQTSRLGLVASLIGLVHRFICLIETVTNIL